MMARVLLFVAAAVGAHAFSHRGDGPGLRGRGAQLGSGDRSTGTNSSGNVQLDPEANRQLMVQVSAPAGDNSSFEEDSRSSSSSSGRATVHAASNTGDNSPSDHSPSSSSRRLTLSRGTVVSSASTSHVSQPNAVVPLNDEDDKVSIGRAAGSISCKALMNAVFSMGQEAMDVYGLYRVMQPNFKEQDSKNGLTRIVEGTMLLDCTQEIGANLADILQDEVGNAYNDPDDRERTALTLGQELMNTFVLVLGFSAVSTSLFYPKIGGVTFLINWLKNTPDTPRYGKDVDYIWNELLTGPDDVPREGEYNISVDYVQRMMLDNYVLASITFLQLNTVVRNFARQVGHFAPTLIFGCGIALYSFLAPRLAKNIGAVEGQALSVGLIRGVQLLFNAAYMINVSRNLIEDHRIPLVCPNGLCKAMRRMIAPVLRSVAVVGVPLLMSKAAGEQIGTDARKGYESIQPMLAILPGIMNALKDAAVAEFTAAGTRNAKIRKMWAAMASLVLFTTAVDQLTQRLPLENWMASDLTDEGKKSFRAAQRMTPWLFLAESIMEVFQGMVRTQTRGGSRGFFQGIAAYVAHILAFGLLVYGSPCAPNSSMDDHFLKAILSAGFAALVSIVMFPVTLPGDDDNYQLMP